MLRVVKRLWKNVSHNLKANKLSPDKKAVGQDSIAQQDTNKQVDDKASSVLNAIPPTGLVLLAIVAIQVGAALAIKLFPLIGANGTVAARIVLSALLLLLAARARVHTFGRTFACHWQLLIVYGCAMAAMNLFFYQAIARIPLGAAVAIEFMGPLGVAAVTSRRISHFAWVALAALGIVLLSPLAGMSLDVLGVIFALLAGTGWAVFIVLSTRVGKRIPGNDGLIIGMSIAALTMILRVRSAQTPTRTNLWHISCARTWRCSVNWRGVVRRIYWHPRCASS